MRRGHHFRSRSPQTSPNPRSCRAARQDVSLPPTNHGTWRSVVRTKAQRSALLTAECPSGMRPADARAQPLPTHVQILNVRQRRVLGGPARGRRWPGSSFARETCGICGRSLPRPASLPPNRRSCGACKVAQKAHTALSCPVFRFGTSTPKQVQETGSPKGSIRTFLRLRVVPLRDVPQSPKAMRGAMPSLSVGQGALCAKP